MASQRPMSILLSKTDMMVEEISALSNEEAWKLIYANRAFKRKKKDNRLQICFTGFGATQKQTLSDLAGTNDFNVVTSVTKKLDFLCCGENAGPKKMDLAEAQGVQCLTEAQFILLIETGELPIPQSEQPELLPAINPPATRVG